MKSEREIWHGDVFLQNEWTLKYKDMMDNARAENRIPIPGTHATHHIIPESFFINRSRKGPPGWLPGNPEDPSNIVVLTHREHAQAHIWLWDRMTTGKSKQKMAVPIRILMRRANSDEIKSQLTVDKLEELMRNLAENNKDNTVRNWLNRDGRKFTGTRYDLEKWAGLERGALQRLTATDSLRTLYGWWIEFVDEKSPPLRARQHDVIIREWIHVDGRTFIGTRLDLEEWAGLKYRALKHLVGPKARKVSHGWRINTNKKIEEN